MRRTGGRTRWRRRVALAAVLLASACSSAPVASGESTSSVSGAETSVDVEVAGLDEDLDELIEPGLIPDLGGMGFECFGQLPFTDLFVLDERPSLGAEEFASLERVTELGEADAWVSFPNGVRMHREPLADSVPRPVMVMPPDSTQPVSCTPFWLEFYDSIAFQVVSEPLDGSAVLSIESCRDPASVEVGVRVFDGAAVVWLWSREFAEPCPVDGSQTLTIDVPLGLDRIHSGQLWPFGPPLLSSWHHYREAFPDDVEAPERPPIEISCFVENDSTLTTVRWVNRPWDVTVQVESDDGEFRSGSQAWGVLELGEAEVLRELWLLRNRLTELGNPADLPIPTPFAVGGKNNEVGGVTDILGATGVERTYSLTASRGDEVVTTSCESVVVPAVLPEPTCTVEIVGFSPRLTVTPASGAFLRNDVEIDLAPSVDGSVDTSAVSGQTYTYVYRVVDTTGRGRSPQSTTCGTVTLPRPGDLAESLMLGAQTFAQSSLLPYAYFTVESGGVVRDLRMEPGASGLVIVNPPPDVEDIDPFGLHERLLDAIAAGSDVTAVVDLVSGLPTEWTIDGERWELACFLLDNRPPELRDGPCDPAFDLISTN